MIRLDIRGMHCASCVGRIEKALRAVPGVVEASVNLATRRATVEVERPSGNEVRSGGDSSPRMASLVEAVRAAGFEAERLATDSDIDPRAGVAQTTSGSAGEPSGTQPGTRPGALDSRSEESTERAALQRKLFAAAAPTALLFALAMSHGAWAFAETAAGRWTQAVLATFVVFGPGAFLLGLALRAARARHTDMHTLVALGVLAAYVYSALAMLTPGLFPGPTASTSAHDGHVGPPIYFEAAAAIVTFVLLGRLLEARARVQLGDAVRGLQQLVPQTVRRRRGEQHEVIPVAELQSGDEVLVGPGERLPADGLVIEGESSVDESFLTGESLPLEKSVGGTVACGSLNQQGALVVRVTHAGHDTMIARLAQAVEEAQSTRAPIARLADRISAVFVPAVLILAGLTFVAWAAFGTGDAALATATLRAVAVLVIACPCALGLATPAAIAVGVGRAAELGVLFKGGAVIEAAARIDTVFLDKTGTLTEGRPALVDIVTVGDRTQDELLRLAASVERASEHPLGRAIAQAAEQRGLALAPCARFRAEPGGGVRGECEGALVLVGQLDWLRTSSPGQRALEHPDASALETQAEAFAERGRTPVYVVVGGELAGLVTLADRPAAGAAEAVRALVDAGLKVRMLTGDRRGTALAIARELGVTAVEAGLSPADKARLVTEARDAGARVAMVGDGVNDAHALALADVGVAVVGGTDIALAAADVALLGGTGERAPIEALPRAFALARATLATIRRNLAFAFVYNLLALPLAAGVLQPWTGWELSPVIASAAMSLSSVSVLLSSLALRRSV